jgi:hypothetical protein
MKVLLLSLSLSLGIQASEFCQDPLKVVCTQTQEERNLRDQEIGRIKEEIRKEADAKAKKRLEELTNSGNGGGIFGGLSRWIKQNKIYNQEIIRAAQARLSSFEQDIVSPSMVATIKNYLKSAVTQSAASESQKKNLHQRIDKVVVGNFSDYMDRANVENSFLAQYFKAHCGLDGLVDNAFATRLDGQDYVLICPGWLITLNREKDAQAVFHNVFQVLAHEISHHMDYAELPAVYENYKQCFKDLYGNMLNSKDGDSRSCLDDAAPCTLIKQNIEKNIVQICAERKEQCTLGFICGIKEKLCLKTQRLTKMAPYRRCMKEVGDKCLERRVVSHMGEISADYWGSEVMALYMANENLSVVDSEEFIKTNMMNLCGSGDEGVHPSGDFRITRIIRHNPGINQHLQCPLEAETKACSLKGQINL